MSDTVCILQVRDGTSNSSRALVHELRGGGCSVCAAEELEEERQEMLEEGVEGREGRVLAMEDDLDHAIDICQQMRAEELDKYQLELDQLTQVLLLLNMTHSCEVMLLGLITIWLQEADEQQRELDSIQMGQRFDPEAAERQLERAEEVDEHPVRWLRAASYRGRISPV